MDNYDDFMNLRDIPAEFLVNHSNYKELAAASQNNTRDMMLLALLFAAVFDIN